MKAQLERDGYEMRHGVVGAGELKQLRAEVSRLQDDVGKACVRDVFRRSELLRSLARAHQPSDGVIPVRGILFDKTPEENWPVPWHQDLSIAVAARPREEPEDYAAWTVKDGVPHVQPPIGLLEEMITVRLHLDETPEENGALRVVPGSHLLGRLAADQIGDLAGECEEVICAAAAGDVLLMKPLVLHSSGRSCHAAGFAHRQVVHLEFAPADALVPGLSWREG